MKTNTLKKQEHSLLLITQQAVNARKKKQGIKVFLCKNNGQTGRKLFPENRDSTHLQKLSLRKYTLFKTMKYT